MYEQNWRENLKAGYEDAVSLAKAKLETLSSESVVRRCGVRWDEHKKTYHIPWCTEERDVSLSKPPIEILFLHYLTSEGTKQPENKLISYRDIKPAGNGAMFYEPKFIQRSVNPLVKHFGEKPDKLLSAGKFLGGIQSAEGDVSVRINLLPYVPLTYIIWAGNDEFEPSGTILFDKTCIGWFGAEDLAVLASLGAYELINVSKTSKFI